MQLFMKSLISFVQWFITKISSLILLLLLLPCLTSCVGLLDFFKKSINIGRKLEPYSPEHIPSFITSEVLMCFIIISVHRSYGFSYICNVLHTWGTIKTQISDSTCLRKCVSSLFLLIGCNNKVIIILQKSLALSFLRGQDLSSTLCIQISWTNLDQEKSSGLGWTFNPAKTWELFQWAPHGQ